MNRIEEIAGTFATYRNLVTLARRHNLPTRTWNAHRRYWWQRFAFALCDELDRDLFIDEVDAMLFLHVGSGAS